MYHASRIKHHDQRGQTLLETIIAIFIMTTALSSGLALAIYAFASSKVSQNEIIGANLAREGVEVVRMMRDSNWLASDTKGGPWDLTNCDDLAGKLCYPLVYEKVPPYNDYDLQSGNYRAMFNSSTQAWSLDSTDDFDLYLQNGVYSHTPNGTAFFSRMVNITHNPDPPYTPENPEIIVKSVVAWRGPKCTEFTTSQDLLSLATSCKVMVEEHMTNWKDYK